jgi:copper transport protein
MRLLVRRLVAVALALLAAFGVLLGGGGTAFAHASLVNSTPAANSVLEVGPEAIVLDFDEAIEAGLASIVLYDSDSRALEVGSPTAGADDTIVSVTAPSLDDGLYAVVWRVTSADGHVVDGAFSFQVGTADTGDAQELIDAVRNGVRAEPAVRWWYGVARFLSLLGVLLLVGAGWWLLQPLLDLASRRAARRIAVVAVGSLLLGSAAAFGLFGAEAVAGSVGDAFSPSVWGDVAGTQTGTMLLLRLAMAVVLAVLVALARHRRTGWWRGAAFAAGLFALYTFPAAGHPNALHPAALWISVDLLHLIAIAVWLGGLVALLVAGKATLAEPEGERFAARFSNTALVAVAVIVVTGVVQGLRLADGLDDLTATDWGRLLLTKVTVVAALVAVGGVSRWLLQHDGAASLRRTVLTEAIMGVVVVGMAAGMVALPPQAPVAAQPFATQLSSSGLIAIISLGPGSVGSNEMHLTMTPPGGSITPIVGVTARVRLESANIPDSPVTLVREGPNHYSGTITFPRSGEWTLEILVQITDTQTVLLSSTVPIP